jgi:HD-like signal output (HDOD) protein
VTTLAAAVTVLGGQDLPVLRQTLEELRRLRKQEDRITGRDISRVVLRDPMMTLRVLRYAESKRTSRQPTDITTVEHAVMMHGITSFFANFSKLKTIEEVLAGYPQALRGALGVISRAYQASIIAGNLAAARHDAESDEVMISALLHEMAEMLLWICMPESAIHLQQVADHSEGLRSASLQRVALGFPLLELQLELARNWKLPSLLLSLMDDLHADKPRVRNVTLAAALARHTSHGWYDAAIPDDIKGVRSLIGGHVDASYKLVKQAMLQAARNWKYFGVRPNAAWIPLEPGSWPDNTGSTLNVEANPDALLRATQVMQAEGAAGPDSDVIAALLYGVVKGMGLVRAAYGKVNVGTRAVEFQASLMAKGGLSCTELQFPLGSPHLFSRLLDRAQGLWCGAATRQQLLPHLPEALAIKLAQTDFFAMSLHGTDGKPLAFVYADMGGHPLEAERYGQFKQLTLLLHRHLQRAPAKPAATVR